MQVTATLLLIRHAAHGHLGQVLSGRMPGVPLSVEGRVQAATLAMRLTATRLAAVLASPVERAHETAAAIAAAQGRTVEIAPALDEIDFGDWTGRRFDALDGDPAWAEWNTRRSTACPPGGETMAGAQARAWSCVREVAARFPGETVALVSHADVLKAVIAQVIGLSLDRLLTFDVDPASISQLVIGDWGARLVSLNERAD
jgi:broad specificity phosphatase PhoE